ncbi:DUF2282 domain-containing protein [Trinickia sp. NRRL B-1857]
MANAVENDGKSNGRACADEATKSMDKGAFKAEAKGICSQHGGSPAPGP